MTGRVIGYQPLISVTFRLPNKPDLQIEFVIDTGFEGTLTLPAGAIAAMQLPFHQNIEAKLADGSRRPVDVHRATILWDGTETNVTVLALGHRPLLGTMLLAGHDLAVRFVDGGEVSVQPVSSP